MIIELLKVGNMKTDIKTKNYTIFESGYNPKIQLMSNSYTVKLFYENSTVKNTTADIIKNKTIVISNEIKKI